MADLRRKYRLAAALIVMLGLPLMSGEGGQAPQSRTASRDDSLQGFLRTYLNGHSAVEDKTTRFQAAYVRLSGQRDSEVIVHVTGRSWCGSGGCLTLILAPRGQSIQVVARITISRPPIRVLRSASKGWHDLGVWVQGGGIQPGYEAVLRFDGRSYPGNPSVPPATRAAGSEGDIVVRSGEAGVPLYPTLPILGVPGEENK